MVDIGEAPCSDGDWLEQVRTHLMCKMTEYAEDQIEFSVLSLVRDPLADYTEQLARNVGGLQSIRDRLTAAQLDDIKGVLGADGYQDVLLGASTALGLTEDKLNLAAALDCEKCSIDELPQEYIRLVNSQKDIKRSIMEELQLRESDDAFAEGRRHNYARAVEFWARALAQKDGVVKELLS